MNIKPLGRRVLLKAVEAEAVSEGGIILVPTSAKEVPTTAKVVAIGTDHEFSVGVGDLVVLAKYSGTEVRYNGETFITIPEEDILAVMTGKTFAQEHHKDLVDACQLITTCTNAEEIHAAVVTVENAITRYINQE